MRSRAAGREGARQPIGLVAEDGVLVVADGLGVVLEREDLTGTVQLLAGSGLDGERAVLAAKPAA